MRSLPPPSSVGHPPEQPLTILIIEDDPLMQLGLQHALGHHPHFAVLGTAADGETGVQLAHQLRPDVVIMDIGLPRLNGILATRQIKIAHPEMRVVVLTSHNSEQETILALAQGADAYCIKGSQINQIIEAIQAVQSGGLYLDEQVRHVVSQLKSSSVQENQPLAQHPPQFSLSGREIEVLRLLVQGLSNSAIAETLFLSESTIKAHLRSIMTKFAVNDRVQVAVIALRAGLVD